MDMQDYQNVQRMVWMLAEQWECPVWVVEQTIQLAIDQGWEKAALDPNKKALWDRSFPNGKPSPEQYILHLGHAHERGEDLPYLL